MAHGIKTAFHHRSGRDCDDRSERGYTRLRPVFHLGRTMKAGVRQGVPTSDIRNERGRQLRRPSMCAQDHADHPEARDHRRRPAEYTIQSGIVRPPSSPRGCPPYLTRGTTSHIQKGPVGIGRRPYFMKRVMAASVIGNTPSTATVMRKIRSLLMSFTGEAG
jgi:hypothetical protein